MKKSTLSAIIALLVSTVFITSSCSGDVYFPIDDYTPASNDTELNDPGSSEVEVDAIDFYIQGSKYMSGFLVGDKYRKIPGYLYNTANTLWKDSQKRYYRFDYMTKNFDNYPRETPGFTPFAYYMSETQFTQGSVEDESFYTFDWYTQQPNGNPKSYEQDIGRNVGDFNDNYLSTVITQLDKDSLSVIITDLVDSGFSNTERLREAMRDYLRDDNDGKGARTISVVQILSDFKGDVYVPSSMLQNPQHEGLRPFYILIFGKEKENALFCESLQEKLPETPQKVVYLPMVGASSEIQSGVVKSDVENNEYRDGVSKLLYGDVDGEERDNINYKESSTIYYKVNDEKSHITAIIPFDDGGPEVFDNFVIKASLYGIDENDNTYKEIELKKQADAVTVSECYLNEDNDIEFEIEFNKNGLQAASLSESIVKLRLIAEAHISYDNNNAFNTIVNHSRDGVSATNKEDKDKQDYFGSGTVSLDGVIGELWDSYLDRIKTQVGYVVIYLKI